MDQLSDGFTSTLAAGLAPDLLERFLRYVRIDTQSRHDGKRCPSSPGQLDLARLLAEELRGLGLSDVDVDEHGYLFATLPGASGPVIGLLAHLDTTPDAPGAGVEPIVHHGWDGSVIELPRGGTRLDPAAMPELAAKRGHDIVTASGDTLLGADDKAGVAAIMAAVRHLALHPELPRATLRIGLTPDEEIGEGPALFDRERFGARCAYTLDGSSLGELQDESFSALEAVVTIDGVDVHPGFATGKMVSALRLAATFVAELPYDRLTPATSSGREGFIHPVSLTGTPAHAEVRMILRDFDDEQLDRHLALVRQTAESVAIAEPQATVTVTDRVQYRNMRRFIDRDPDVVAVAEEAYRAEGIEPVRKPIRGGTDGSQLSEMGLPTPNIFDGGHEFHSVREWASVQEMAAAAAVAVRLAQAWAGRAGG